MSKSFDAKLKRLSELKNRREKAAKAVAEYTAKLAEDCPHPESMRGTFKHHFSNGYGKWRIEVMPHCNLCNKVQYNSAYNYKWGPIPVNNYDD